MVGSNSSALTNLSCPVIHFDTRILIALITAYVGLFSMAKANPHTRRNMLTGSHFLSFRVGSRNLRGTTSSADFWRNTGFSTVYIGSSNISESAMTSGLEWNIKLSQYDSGDILEKIRATFEGYWNNLEFTPFIPALDSERLRKALKSERRTSQDEANALGFHFDLKPYYYQQEILDKLKAEREVHHSFRNLVVAATGTGKTVIAAFDYRDFCRANPNRPNRLLFVAHRREILSQSLSCFRGILKDLNFGSMMVGGLKPDSFDHLFVSIQSFNSKDLTEVTSPDFYDYIVIDEFHHAAAPSYQELLEYYEPKVLLGLTATPERADGRSIYTYFQGRVAAEIRLWEAIERKLLSPFHYFGVTDNVDLSQVHWVAAAQAGLLKGYQVDAERERLLAAALGRLSLLNSRRWITFMQKILPEIRSGKGSLGYSLTGGERTMLTMLHYSLWGKGLSDLNRFASIEEGIYWAIKDQRLYQELMDLLDYQFSKINFVDKPLAGFEDEFPLDLYCSYTFDQILVALGKHTEQKKSAFREGVLYLAEQKLDVFFVTLNKSEKDYSPSTMYQDYSINEELFHWQSQSRTTVESLTGRRYLSQPANGGKVLFFVREYKKEGVFASPFTCLGLADFQSHYGSAPISIVWKMKEPLPGFVLKKTAKV